MPTPMSKFAEIAQRFHVDPHDDEAVDRFFERDVHQLSLEEREGILAELLDADGEPDTTQSRSDLPLPKNVQPLPITAIAPLPVPQRALDPVRDGDELTLVVEWIQRWLNDFLMVSGLGVIADVSLSGTRVQVALAGPDAPRLESDEPQLLESMKQLTSHVAERHPAVEDLVDFIVRGGVDDARFIHGVSHPISLTAGAEPKIIRMDQISVRAMSPEAAARALQSSTDEFIVFRDSETDTVSVIYKRRDRNLGLIAPR